MVNLDPDKTTDYAAVIVSIIVALSLWGVLLYRYATTGELSTVTMSVAALFVALAVITLFGVEKVNKALDILRQR